jgi:hypothetical protein
MTESKATRLPVIAKAVISLLSTFCRCRFQYIQQHQYVTTFMNYLKLLSVLRLMILAKGVI